MDIEIKIHCAPIGNRRCEHVRTILNNTFNSKNILEKKTDYFEHIARTNVSTHKDAEDLMNKIRYDSVGQIMSIDYDIIKN